MQSRAGRNPQFYCSLFDDQVRWRGQLADGRPAAHVGDGRNYIALFQGLKPSPNENNYRAAGFNHFGFVVDSLDSTMGRLRELGVTPGPVQDYEPGRRSYFFDPNGVEIELVEYDRVS